MGVIYIPFSVNSALYPPLPFKEEDAWLVVPINDIQETVDEIVNVYSLNDGSLYHAVQPAEWPVDPAGASTVAWASDYDRETGFAYMADHGGISMYDAKTKSAVQIRAMDASWVLSMAVDSIGKYLYFLYDDGSAHLYRMSLDGLSPVEYVFTSGVAWSSLWDVAIDPFGRYVFLAGEINDWTDYHVVRYDLAGTNPLSVFTHPITGGSTSSITYDHVSENVFLATSDAAGMGVVRIARDGSSVTHLGSSGWYVAVDGGEEWVYYTIYDDPWTVYRMKTGGTQVEEFVPEMNYQSLLISRPGAKFLDGPAEQPQLVVALREPHGQTRDEVLGAYNTADRQTHDTVIKSEWPSVSKEARHLDYHRLTGHTYMLDAADVVKYNHEFGTASLVRALGFPPDDLAVDWKGDDLYLLDRFDVYRMPLSGSSAPSLVFSTSNDLANTVAMAVDAVGGHVFVAGEMNTAENYWRVMQYDMDGTSPTVLFEEIVGEGFINDLAYDYYSEALYVASDDVGGFGIFRIPLTGSPLFDENASWQSLGSGGYNITVDGFHQWIYFGSAESPYTIWRMKTDGGMIEEFIPESSYWGLSMGGSN